MSGKEEEVEEVYSKFNKPFFFSLSISPLPGKQEEPETFILLRRFMMNRISIFVLSFFLSLSLSRL